MKPELSIGGIDSVDQERPRPFASSEPVAAKTSKPFVQHGNPFLPGYRPPPKEALDPLELASVPFLFHSDPGYVKAREALGAVLARRDALLDERDSEELISAKKGYDGSDASFARLKKATAENEARIERGRMDAERMEAEIVKAASLEVEARIAVLRKKASEIQTPKVDRLLKVSAKLAAALQEVEALLPEARDEEKEAGDQARRIGAALNALGESAPSVSGGLGDFFDGLEEMLAGCPYIREEIRESLIPISKVPKGFWSRRRRR
jgi:hypothetical protein